MQEDPANRRINRGGRFRIIVYLIPLSWTRAMNRLKGLYRSWAIPCTGDKVYSPRYRSWWLEQLSQAGVHRRAERLYQQLDALVALRRDIRRELLTESRKHSATALLREIPRLGPIRVALLIALLQTPYRFRTKRQLWAYCGLGLQTRSHLQRPRPPPEDRAQG